MVIVILWIYWFFEALLFHVLRIKYVKQIIYHFSKLFCSVRVIKFL